VAPYYHYNQNHYIGGPSDPLTTDDNRTSNYVGGYIAASVVKERHTARFGTDSYGEHDNTIFSLAAHDGTRLSLNQQQTLWAGVVGFFAEDQYKVTNWLTVNAGLRYSRFAGTISEHSTDPRLGAAIQIPKANWVIRGAYGHYYQHPPLNSFSGPVLQFALSQGVTIIPIPGERDKIWEVGLGGPIRGWNLDFDYFFNRGRNVVDHEVLGNSNILVPVTIERGKIRGFESTLHSPALLQRRLTLHWAFSHQIAQAGGAVSGGLFDFAPPPTGYFYMDHDQRTTFNSGFELNLPYQFFLSSNILFGSGFVLGDGPEHMPSHTTFDISVGKNVGERLLLRVTALNVANNEYLTGFENSFAGTHYSTPRDVSVQLKYRFHY
jgi:outer membrane receptor protein involved in Fe transport